MHTFFLLSAEQLSFLGPALQKFFSFPSRLSKHGKQLICLSCCSAIRLIVKRRSDWTKLLTRSVFSLVFDVVGLPDRGSSSTES